MDNELPPRVESTRELRPLTEWFSIGDDGQQTFSRCTFGFITDEHRVYLGRAPVRKYNLTSKIINESLKFVLDEEVYPEAPSHITIVSTPVTDKNVFVKGPTLSLYDTLDTGSLPKLLLQEAETLELLSRNGPHPNIVRYHGCLIKRGRIVGIVLAQLSELLEYRVRDGGVEKFNGEDCMRKIESAVQYIHSLGLAHNDLKPTNIMVDEDDEPFIIDFGSCQPFGSLLITGGTPGWVDEDYTHSARRNDEIALRKIRTWLNEKASS